MNKYLLTPIVFVLAGLVSGCTTERSAPPQTVMYQDKQPGGDSREAAREEAREGAREPNH